MSAKHTLLKTLADGQFHSGQHLANELGITRAAIWKQIQTIQARGIIIDAVRGKGYRWQDPQQLLDLNLIKSGIPASVKQQTEEIILLDTIDSTNRYLLERLVPSSNKPLICLSETQTAGRGRRGRHWVSPYASNLYLSIGWQHAEGPQSFAGLSLAMGVAVMRVLSHYRQPSIGLKWPNDIIANGKKLGGILIEMAGDASGPCSLVVGLGLNIQMPVQLAQDIDQPWVDLSTLLGQSTPSRNQLAAELITEMCTIINEYPRMGFSQYQAEWQQWDQYNNKVVTLIQGEHQQRGTVTGVDQHGNLLLNTAKGIQTFNAGEISLRAAV